MSELVNAVKSYTYMDQAPIQSVDINQGLDDTLMVMRHKLRDVDVSRAYDEAGGIADPRIWTAERDVEMWQALEQAGGA